MSFLRYAIGLGSNIEPRVGFIKKAIQRLYDVDESAVISRFYESVPIGPGQHNYINAALVCRSHLTPQMLLNLCQQIEEELGRVRTIKWGDRTIDLDILAAWDSTGNCIEMQTAKLILPHPRVTERAFVLKPLSDVAGDRKIRSNGKVIAELLEELDSQTECSVWELKES